MQKHAQKRELLGGVEAAVATPGRLIDLVQCGACSLQRVTMLVVDEVDRCFDLGFEAQVCTATYTATCWIAKADMCAL
jgi:superfamily II DNA/RNA helicase